MGPVAWAGWAAFGVLACLLLFKRRLLLLPPRGKDTQTQPTEPQEGSPGKEAASNNPPGYPEGTEDHE